MSADEVAVTLTVNGELRSARASARATLAELLRDHLQLTGTHLGCEHGVCGACTVLLDGRSARSCLVFAWQADGAIVTTIEGLAGDEPLGPLQQACRDRHSFQCGFCTPGMLCAATELLAERDDPSEAEVREALAGNLCRCTGYEKILDAVRLAAS